MPPTIAALLAAPPEGFMAVHAARAAATFANPFEHDVSAFWAACTRADWMLALAGWCGAPTRPLIGLSTQWIREVNREGGLDARMMQACADLDAFGRGAELGGAAAQLRHEEPAGAVDDRGAHFLRLAVYQACAAASGPALGPSYPMVCAQTALYPARSLTNGGQPDADFLSKAADDLRHALSPPPLPRRIPTSWAEAVAGGWPPSFASPSSQGVAPA